VISATMINHSGLMPTGMPAIRAMRMCDQAWDHALKPVGVAHR